MLTASAVHPGSLFHREGYHEGLFQETPSFERLQRTLYALHSEPLRDGFSWLQKEKYIGSKDLRPHPHLYDDVFIDILFDQGIPQQLEELTGSRLFLLSMNVRVNLPGTPYSSWHRDTSFYGNKTKGIVPPAINLHYYPCFTETPEPQLRIWPRTHRLSTPFKLFDRLLVAYAPAAELISSNAAYSILDTSLIHQIAPTHYKKGAMRLMYSFVREFQLGALPEQRSLHEGYRARLS